MLTGYFLHSIRIAKTKIRSQLLCSFDVLRKHRQTHKHKSMEYHAHAPRVSSLAVFLKTTCSVAASYDYKNEWESLTTLSRDGGVMAEVQPLARVPTPGPQQMATLQN